MSSSTPLSTLTQRLSHLLHRLTQTPPPSSNATSTTTTTAATTPLLQTLYYALTLLHSHLLHRLTTKYTLLATQIAAQASQTLLPSEALIATLEPPHLPLVETCASVDSLRGAVGDAVCLLRLGTVAQQLGKARGEWAKPKRDPAVKFLVWAEVGARTGYVVCENAAFLGRRGVLRGEGWEARTEGWGMWARRFWVVNVVVTGLRFARVRQMRFNEEFGAEGEVGLQSKELEERWWRDLYAELGWMAWAFHWGIAADEEEMRSVSDEAAVGIAGFVPSVLALRGAWRESV